MRRVTLSLKIRGYPTKASDVRFRDSAGKQASLLFAFPDVDSDQLNPIV